MTTKLEIISNALQLLGDDPLENYDGSPGSNAGLAHYDSTYETLLAWHPWSFAGAKKSLGSPLAEAPLNEYQYAFQLPGDFICLRKIYPHTLDFGIYEDRLLCNQSEVAIDYTFKVALSKAPSYFITYFEMALAAKLAMPVTQNATLMRGVAEQVVQFGQHARATDSIGRSQRPPQSNPFINARG